MSGHGHPNIINEVELEMNSTSWTFPCPSSSLSQSRPFQNTQTTQPHEPTTVPNPGSVFNHYTHQTHLTSTSSETEHLCLVCNEELVLSNFDRNACGNFENLCKILQLPIYEDFTPEINPFCVSCVKLMDEYFALQKKTQELISQISTLRTIMAIKVVKSFPLTASHRQNYGVKQKMNQACSNKIDMTKMPCDEDFERTYHSILHSLSTNETNLDAGDNGSGLNERKEGSTSENASTKIDELEQLRCISPVSNHSDNFTESHEAIDEDDSEKETMHQNHALELPKSGGTTFFDTPAKITKDGRIVSTKNKKPVSKKSKICQYCPKEFPTNFALQMHERIHTGEKPFVCEKCRKAFTTKGNLNKHVLIHCMGTTNDEPLPSNVPIRATDVIQNAPSQENPEDPGISSIGAVNPPNILLKRSNLSCRMCSKIFPSQSQLDTHMRVHTGERPFTCSVCGRGFTTKFNMQKHEMTHDETRYQGEPQHECEICHKKFHLKMTLYTHRQDHFRNKPRPSGKTPRRKRAKKPTSTVKVPLQDPMKKESRATDSKELKELGGSPLVEKTDAFPAPASNFDDDDNGAFDDDMHDNDDSDDHNIPEVFQDESSKNISSEPGKAIKTKTSMKNTRTKSKPDDTQQFCTDKETEKDKKKIQRRKKTANKPTRKVNLGSKVRRKRTVGKIGKKKPVCSVCGKPWPNHYVLKEHMRVHTGEKPFACPHPGCSRTFADRGNIMKHFRSHDKTRFDREPEFVCDICGKRYHLAGTLYHHKRKAHLGIKYRYPRPENDVPTTCPICHKFLQRSSHLNEHMNRIHKGEKKYKCEICEKPFFSSSDAKGHVIYHDPTKLQRMLFKYNCTACPPEYIGYPSKEAVRLHWAKEHKRCKLPKEYKAIQKPQPAGKYECKECPQDNRPVYKYPRGLQRHMKAYHKGKSASKKFRLTRHNIAKLEVNESDSDSSSGNGSSDEDDDEDERKSKKNYTRKRLKYKPEVEMGELSTKLKALVKELVGDKVLTISLTRMDDDIYNEVKNEPMSDSDSDSNVE